MSTTFSYTARVTRAEQITPLIKHFSFERVDGKPFGPFSAGSHAVIGMSEGESSHKNPYSLVGSSNNFMEYEIAVRVESNGRGGSLFMHNNVEIGTELEIGNPFNLFPVYKPAKKHLMIAGGVGITPFVAYIDEMNLMNSDFELHYSIRDFEHGAFAKELQDKYPKQVKLYIQADDVMANFNKILNSQPLGTHVYVCGPHRMVGDVLRIADVLGWPATSVHSEEFKAPDPGNPFTVTLAKSHREINVRARESLLEALEHANIEIPYSCRGGACGFCRTEVIDGEIDHRDYYLTDAEKASGKCIMPCISRAQGDHLTLDI
jgi:ferredoxin-NADP reductase